MTGTKTWSLEEDDSVCRESPYLLGQVEGVWEAEGRLLVVVVDVVVELGVARVAGRTRHDDEEGAGRLHVPRPPVGVIRPCKGTQRISTTRECSFPKVFFPVVVITVVILPNGLCIKIVCQMVFSQCDFTNDLFSQYSAQWSFYGRLPNGRLHNSLCPTVFARYRVLPNGLFTQWKRGEMCLLPSCGKT